MLRSLHVPCAATFLPGDATSVRWPSGLAGAAGPCEGRGDTLPHHVGGHASVR